MDDRFVEVKVDNSNAIFKDKIKNGAIVLLDKTTETVYVPFMTLDGFKKFYGNVEESEKPQ